MTKKLWQTRDSSLAKSVEQYTVGDDYILDKHLIKYDIKASQAHIKMLHQMKVLSNQELQQLEKGLDDISLLVSENKFNINQSQEDGHTAIEAYLCEHYGEVGKKVHTGRSRNDQSLVMLRLYMLDKLDTIQDIISQNIEKVRNKSSKYTDQPMPGYTHMQKAMPTTVSVWLNSFADALVDTLILVKTTKTMIDQNPLGSASGFGINNFKHNREYTTKLLNFSKTQQNPIYCAFSRGYFEKIILQTLSNPMSVYGRFANDMMLFTMSEFNYFSLPNNYTTGSSIMPQKRNYDLFEIMRGNTKLFQGYLQQISLIIDSVPSGYNRDYQLTKGPFLAAMDLIEKTCLLYGECIDNLDINTAQLDAAMTDDLYITDKVYELVKQGVSFREAYLQVKESLLN